MVRTECIQARVLPAEKQAFLCIVEQERRRQSEVLRSIIRAEARRRGFWPLSTAGGEDKQKEVR